MSLFVLQNAEIEMRIQAAGGRVGGAVKVVSFFKSNTDLSAVFYH
jgi:hypothetical protein